MPSGRRRWRAVIDIARAHDAWNLSDEEFAIEFRASVIHDYERSLSVSALF